MPLNLLKIWIAEEKRAGANNPQQAVLSTVSKDGIPHARIVAIREIADESLIFFTQSGTKKVTEMRANPHVNMTFWLERYQREVIFNGRVEALTPPENETYWASYPKEAQIRFYAYAPSSGQTISSKGVLEQKKIEIQHEFIEKKLPISPFYCGFRVIPERFVFYHYRTDELSDVIQYVKLEDGWEKQLLSP